ncbi:Fatty acid synthase [Aphelenchoides besseyi]|nr:Fatty acid synthase [Aphelenchoides besseyi]
METLIDLFNNIASDPSARQRVVLQDGDREWTLAELDKETRKLAGVFIQKFGCQKGSCVAIYMNKSAEYVLSYIAALRAGSAYLPLDISYPEGLLNSVLDEVTPSVICTTPDHATRLPANASTFVFQAGWSLDDSKVDLPTDIGPDDIAYIVYSSGTTGKPKGIQCPHRGAVVSYGYRFKNYPYDVTDVVACNVFFVWEIFRPILKGIKMVVIPDDVIYDSSQLCHFLKRHKVTRMLFTPSLLETILDTQKGALLDEAFKHFRVIHLCGEVVTCALLARIMRHFSHAKIVNLYSISETADVSVCDLNEFHKRGEDRKYAPVGRVIDGVRVLILDAALQKVPIGVPGEIYIAGKTLAHGYIQRPELNKNRFLEVPREYQHELASKRMYRTGDWGYVLPNNILEICGRCDTLVRIRGYGVELQAIEATLLKMSAVASCAVVSVGDEGEDKQLAAYIVLREQISRKNLRAELKRLLPFYMIPKYFIFMEKFPVLAASHKIDRRALPPVDLQKDVVETDALPQTPTEKKLAQIWSEVLQNSSLDIQESFFDLGGHSLLAARLINKVAEEFNVTLTIRDLFAAPSVFEQAKLLDGCERKSPENTVDLDNQVETHDLKDNVMDLHLRAFWRSTEWGWGNRFYRSNILLTGATGYLGAHILHELLVSSQASIVCLIRESSKESVDARLRHALKKYGLWDDTIAELVRDRVRNFAADIALVQFGLQEETFLFLTYEIDVVIHAAAYVNLIFPYQALHGINVLGSKNVLDFCHRNKIKPLHYISTDAVIPHGLEEVDEDYDISMGREKLSDGYSQSKYVAEQLVKRSQQRGLPVIIYRLGNQAASANVAHWNDQDFTYLMLKAVLHLGKTPNVDWKVEITPVDFSAKFIADLTTKHFCENVGKIFHLINTKAPTWNEFMDWVRNFGYQIEPVDVNVWIELVTNSSDHALQQIQRLIQVMVSDETFFLMQSSYKRSNTDKLLETLNLRYPTINERLVHHWLRLFIERHYISRPKTRTGTTLINKVCIVTGASDGIGEAIARAAAVEGAKVVLAARRKTRLDDIINQLSVFGVNKSSLLAVGCDVTKMEDVQHVASECVQRFSRIDCLINCAGCMYYCLASNGYTEEWRKQIDINCHGTTNMISAVLPQMIRQNQGLLINITSDAGKRGFAGLAVYSGSKFYIEGFTQALRQELIGNNIRITNIQPGDVSTKLASMSTDKEASEKYDCSKAGHKILQPEDVARAAVYVLSQPSHVAINELLIEPQAAPI